MSRELSDQDVAAFRVRLVEAATKLFQTQGVEAVSLRNLAAETGCSRSTPYRYFKDKGDILTAVRIAAQERLTEHTRAALANAKTVRQQLQAVADAYVHFALEEPDLYFLLIGSPAGRAQRTPDFVTAVNSYRRVADAPLVEAHAQGLMKSDINEYAHVFWSALHGLVSLHLTGNFVGRINFGQLRARMENIILDALPGSADASKNRETEGVSEMSEPAWIAYGARVKGTYLGKEFKGVVTNIGFPALPFQGRTYAIRADAPINVSAFASMTNMRQALNATLSPKGESLDTKGRPNGIMSVKAV